MYDTARTPYQRLLEQGVLTEERRSQLQREYYKSNPVKLLKTINKELERL